MASLSELKKRLQSVKTTRQIAGAMKTSATAKYAKASALLASGQSYADALCSIAAQLGGITGDELAVSGDADAADERRNEFDAGAADNGLDFGEQAAEVDGRGKTGKKLCSTDAEDKAGEKRKTRALYLLVSGNRGLCGGYNHELFAYFADVLNENPKDEAPPAVAAVGRKAMEHCAEKGIELRAAFAVSDVPSFEEAASIARWLTDLYSRGEVSRVLIVHQRFINMLKHEPAVARLLPPQARANEDDGESINADEILYVPDADTVRRTLLPLMITQQTYSLLLQCACGAQAATLMAMRSAYDNAEASAAELSSTINRRRQAEVTQSVLETAADTESRY